MAARLLDDALARRVAVLGDPLQRLQERERVARPVAREDLDGPDADLLADAVQLRPDDARHVRPVPVEVVPARLVREVGRVAGAPPELRVLDADAGVQDVRVDVRAPVRVEVVVGGGRVRLAPAHAAQVPRGAGLDSHALPAAGALQAAGRLRRRRDSRGPELALGQEHAATTATSAVAIAICGCADFRARLNQRHQLRLQQAPDRVPDGALEHDRMEGPDVDGVRGTYACVAQLGQQQPGGLLRRLRRGYQLRNHRTFVQHDRVQVAGILTTDEWEEHHSDDCAEPHCWVSVNSGPNLYCFLLAN